MTDDARVSAVVSLVLLALASPPVARTTAPVQIAKPLREIAEDAAPISFVVDLRDQLDFAKSAQLLVRQGQSRRARRDWVVDALKTIASDGQARLRPLLERLQGNGAIESWTGISIVNRILVKGRPAAIRALAQHPEVASLAEEVEGESSLAAEEAIAGDSFPGAAPSWPLAAIGATQAWQSGVDGRDVIVGVIDSGASNLHEQLRGNFRGGARSWFDPARHSAQPSDVQLGHGTAVLSCAVGQGRPGGPSGAAPGAKWIAAVGLNAGRYNNVLASLAADWMLNVGQPDVLIVAWRLLGAPCDDSLRAVVNAWRAAETVVVFAAGNSGPSARTDVSPANYTQLFPGAGIALSVGAIDRDQKIYSHSSRGPNRCGDAVFPQLAAPGTEVPVALPAATDFYRTASGTSFAAGYVGGAAALLLQKFPDALTSQIEEALRRTATKLDAAPDGASGYGMVNVPAALDYLEKHR